jgi:hypothetical protein
LQGVVVEGTLIAGHADPGTILPIGATCDKRYTQETIPVDYITGLIEGLNAAQIQTHKSTKDRNNQVDSTKEGILIKAALAILVKITTMEAPEANTRINTRRNLAHSFRAYKQTQTHQIK